MTKRRTHGCRGRIADKIARRFPRRYSNHQRDRRYVLRVLAAFFAEFEAVLAAGDTLSLKDFGRFYVRTITQRPRPSPLTGDLTYTQPIPRVLFHPYKLLDRYLNHPKHRRNP